MTSQAQVGPDQPTLPAPMASPSTLTSNPILNQLLEAKAKQERDLRIASWVDSEYTKCRNARYPFERQWYINLAFYNGRHYLVPVEVTGAGTRLTATKAPAHRVRLVVNHCRTIVRREHSKLTSSKPIPTVVPASNETEDFSAAQVGESLIRAQFGYSEFEAAYSDWVWWGAACGVSFIKQWWDGGAKDYNNMVPPPPPVGQMPDGTEVELTPEMLAEVPGAEQLLNQPPVPSDGKICFERVTPFHIYVPDLLTKDLNKQPYVIQVMTRHPEWVKKAFNLPNVTCDARASNTIMEAGTLITKGMEEHLDAVIVKECWIKPGFHPDFPQGGVVTIVNSKAVQVADTWPLPYPEYPFYKYDGINTGGFYGDSVLVDAIPLNKEINKARSQAIEIRNTMGKPKFVYQQGSVDIRKVNTESGQGIPYTAGYQPPQVIPGTDVPATFYDEIAQSRQDLDDIAGQHEVSRGNTPKDVTSGTAITFLEEQDSSLLSDQVSSIERAIELLGRHYLSLVSEYWDDNRVVKVTGRNNEFEAIHWKQGALKGNIDVRVQTGSALPISKAARQAMITEWIQMGILDPTLGMEILDMADMTRVVDEMLVDKKQAQRENLKMADIQATKTFELLLNPQPGPPDPTTGQPVMPTQDPASGNWMNGDGTPFQPQPPVPVNSWDNHEEHVMWHNQFRKTQEFEMLPDANKTAFELHVQLHQMSLSANIVNTRGQVTQENKQPPPEFPIDEQGDPNAGEASGSEGGDSGGEGEAPPQESGNG